MKTKQKMKLAADLLMTIALLLLMPYEMIGEAAHEWIGTGMFLLFIIHHILNRKWTGNLIKSRYTPMRVVQTILAVLILICMLDSMASGIILSRRLFTFLDIRGAASWARVVHMTSAYWGFVLMSLHLGHSLGHYDRNGRENVSEAVPGPQMDFTDSRNRDCCVRSLCFYKERNFKLHADAGAFCLFRLFRAGCLFCPGLSGCHGIFCICRSLPQ